MDRPTRQPEGVLKDQGRAYLRTLPGALVVAIEVGPIPCGVTPDGQTRWRKNASKGIYDRLVIRYGRVVFIEWKIPGGRLSPEQVDFGNDWRAAGGEAYEIESMEELYEIFPPDQLALDI